MPKLPAADQIMATAITFLIEGEDFNEANLLLSCNLRNTDVINDTHVRLIIDAPRPAYDALTELVEDTRNGWHDWYPGPKAESIERALAATLPHGMNLQEIDVRAAQVYIEPGWENDLREIASGHDMHHQAVNAPDAIRWKNKYRFRSASERQIAEALDQAGVFFVPLALCRITDNENKRVNREPDFIVCSREGNIGILEVDGPPYHSGQNMVARDRIRDRMFEDQGVKIVEHYESKDCYRRPNWVVGDFLARLDR